MGISWFSRVQLDQLGKISRVESGHEKISSGLRILTSSFLCTSAGPHSHVFSQKTPLDRKSGGRTRIVGSGLLGRVTSHVISTENILQRRCRRIEAMGSAETRDENSIVGTKGYYKHWSNS